VLQPQPQQGQAQPAGHPPLPPGFVLQKPPAAAPQESSLVSAAKGVGAGAAGMVFGGEQLAGRGLKAVGGLFGGNNALTRAGGAMSDEGELANKAIQAAMKPSYAQHPIAATAGDFAGSFIGPGRIAKSIEEGLGLAKVGKAASTGAKVGKALVKPAAAGAAAGALTPVDAGQDFWKHKAEQVAAGAGVGAGFGSVSAALEVKSALAAASAANRLTPSRKILLDAGVRLTPGQLGGTYANKAEQKAMSTPIIGDVIHNARVSAVSDFQLATINKALAPLGVKLPPNTKPGYEAVQYAAQKVSQAYESVLPRMAFNPDMQIAKKISSIRKDYSTLPQRELAQFDAFVSEKMQKRILPGGGMSGRTMNMIDQDLGTHARQFSASMDPNQKMLGRAFTELQGAFRDNIERVNPAFAPELQKARKAAALMMAVEKAAGNPKALGNFTPSMLLSAIKSMDSSSRKAGFSRGGSDFQEWAAAGQEHLGATVPDSGTAGRMKTTIPEAIKGALLTAPYLAAARAARSGIQNPGAASGGVGSFLSRVAPGAAVAAGTGEQ
jgi:hypothetical protein